MDFLYFLVKGSAQYGVEKDPLSFLKNYFETGGGFTSAFLIALIVAAAGALIFYGIFGMKVYKLAKPAVYWVVFAIVGAVTFLLTQLLVIGSKAGQTGFFASVVSKFDEITPQMGPEQKNIALAQRTNIEEEMDGFCSAVTSLDVTNAAIAVIIFFVLSLVVKNFTIHAKKIPF